MNNPPVDKENLARQVHAKLLDYYGRPEWRDPLPPLDELVSTILSQSTNDLNRDRAFHKLRQRFDSWEKVRDAPVEELIESVRLAGLANQKAPRIQSILKEITIQRGRLELDFLQDLPVEEARNWLTGFKGVGPKTAAIVLLFSLNMPAFPVDTHVYRVTGRLGLRPEKMTADQAHDFLAALFPESEYGPAHLNIIRLGREICKARKPDCPLCPLRDLCDFYQRVSSA